MEIEKKFLVKNIPSDLEKYPSFEILQGYLKINPDGSSERIRKKNDKYFKTFKMGTGLVREEQELQITKDEFENLWPETEGKRVKKTRYQIPFSDLIIELDIYQENLDGLITAEVEFKSVEDSQGFIPPDWFDIEVTNDLRYSNQNLSQEGLPT